MKEKTKNNSLCNEYDYFGNEYSEVDVHDVSDEYSKVCPNCHSKNLCLLGADSGAWDWVLQQCIDCHYIFIYGWSDF